MNNYEERLTRLEENQYFIEEHLGKLDAEILAHQQSLDELEKSVRMLRTMQEEIRILLAGQHKQGEPELPPHHEPRFW